MNKRTTVENGRVNLNLKLQAKQDLITMAEITGESLSTIVSDLIEAEMKRQKFKRTLV